MQPLSLSFGWALLGGRRHLLWHEGRKNTRGKQSFQTGIRVVITTNISKGQQASCFSLIQPPAAIRLWLAAWTSYSTVLHPMEVLNPPLQLPMDTVSPNPLVDKLWLQFTMYFYIITAMGKEFQLRMLIAFKLYGIFLLSSVWLDLIQCMRPGGAFTGIKPEHPGQHLKLAVASIRIWHAWNTPKQGSQLKTTVWLNTQEIRMKPVRENIMEVQDTLVWL